MNPLGTEDTGLIILFGVCAVLVLAASIRLRVRRHPVAVSTATGLLCGLAVWTIIAALTLATRGTQGYRFDTWLIFVVAGLIPAGAIGLAQGLVSSVIIRLFP